MKAAWNKLKQHITNITNTIVVGMIILVYVLFIKRRVIYKKEDSQE